MLCDIQDLNYYFVSGDIQGDNEIPLQSLPCYEESITESEVSNLDTVISQKLDDVGEELDEFGAEERKYYNNAIVTMICEL